MSVALCYHIAMLNIQNMTYLQGGTPLFLQANLQAFQNQRIGLVGKNGCGKSTLFRLIRAELKPDSGEISLQTGKTLAYVEQEIANSAQPALGAGYELDAIAAAVIGGTSLSGGEGSILGTIIGAFVISVLANGLRILSVPQEWQIVVTGTILVLAVYLDRRRKR